MFGYKPALLQQCAKAESFHFLNTITWCVNVLAQGKAPLFLRPFVAGGVSIALSKPKKGIRPLCSGDPIRRLVAKCFCLGGKDEITEVFKNRNFGVGCPGGVEIVSHSLRDSLEKHKGSGMGLLKIDFKNAFNLVSRSHFVSAVTEIFPAMARWTYWCYEQPTALLYSHERVIDSSSGVQQGDPLGPLYFCTSLLEIVDAIAKLEDVVYNKWYMDDGGVIAPVATLQLVWDILQKMGPALGMQLNPAKCEFSWLDPDCQNPCPIVVNGKDGRPAPESEQIIFVPTNNIEMLGVPLGDAVFNASYVTKKLLNKASTLVKLTEFDDVQAAMFVLRSSYGIVRATHFMRTTPLAFWRDAAGEFDAKIQETATGILGLKFTVDAAAQAGCSSSVGGLSLRSTAEHGPGAFAASFHESAATSGETWVKTGDANLPAKSQRGASQATDEVTIERLVGKANKRNAAHLRCLQKPHANAWLSAVPSDVLGNTAVIKPRNFQIAVRRLLSLPVFDSTLNQLCPYCKLTMDNLGDHALSCKTGGDIITRHNAIRNLTNDVATEGLLSPELEKEGVLGHDDLTRRRPGDVTVPMWSMGKGLAIDVAVICPVNKSNLKYADPCEWYAEVVKHKKYDDAFVGTNFDFAALVFETSGALNQEGEELLKQLFRFAAVRYGERYGVYCGRAWGRYSCAVQSCGAQMILNRGI
jgi:hypothetical protein